jgi:hypothetical protein
MAPTAQQQWDASIAALTMWLTSARTPPDLQHAILGRLQQWRLQEDDNTPLSYNWPGVNDLVRLQDSIAWQAFLEGGVLLAWAAKQQDYYDWLNKKNTGKQWVTTLIKKLWEISWDLWEHCNGELKNPSSPSSLRDHARLDALIAADYADQTQLFRKDCRWLHVTHAGDAPLHASNALS